MTKPDQAIDETEDARDFTDIKRLILGSIGGFSLIFLVAVLVGYSAGTLENRIPDLYDFIVIGTILALIAAINPFKSALNDSQASLPLSCGGPFTAVGLVFASWLTTALIKA